MTLKHIMKICEKEKELYYKEAEILKDDANKAHDLGYLEKSIELIAESNTRLQMAMAIIDLQTKIMKEVENEG